MKNVSHPEFVKSIFKTKKVFSHVSWYNSAAHALHKNIRLEETSNISDGRSSFHTHMGKNFNLYVQNTSGGYYSIKTLKMVAKFEFWY